MKKSIIKAKKIVNCELCERSFSMYNEIKNYFVVYRKSMNVRNVLELFANNVPLIKLL